MDSYDANIHAKLLALDKVLHVLLEDKVILERFEEIKTFIALGGEADDTQKIISGLYQAVNDVASYIDSNRYQLNNFHMYMKEFMQLQHDHAFGFCNGSEYQSRIDQIKMDIDNLYFT